VSGLRIAGAAAVCGVLAACPYLVALISPPGSMILIYLAQLPLFVAGLWLGVGASLLAGLAASLTLVAASTPMTAAVFAGLNAGPVALLVRQSLLARTNNGGAVQWYPPGLLTAWLTGLGLAAIAAALALFGGAEGVQAAAREVLAPVFNRSTRLVSTMNPSTGKVCVQGWERHGPATAELALNLGSSAK